MDGRESLWPWLGVAAVIQVVGGVLIGVMTGEPDARVWLIGGYVIAGFGGLLALVCVVGLGVTAGMLRYDHVRAKR